MAISLLRGHRAGSAVRAGRPRAEAPGAGPELRPHARLSCCLQVLAGLRPGRGHRGGHPQPRGSVWLRPRHQREAGPGTSGRLSRTDWRARADPAGDRQAATSRAETRSTESASLPQPRAPIRGKHLNRAHVPQPPASSLTKTSNSSLWPAGPVCDPDQPHTSLGVTMENGPCSSEPHPVPWDPTQHTPQERLH